MSKVIKKTLKPKDVVNLKSKLSLIKNEFILENVIAILKEEKHLESHERHASFNAIRVGLNSEYGLLINRFWEKAISLFVTNNRSKDFLFQCNDDIISLIENAIDLTKTFIPQFGTYKIKDSKKIHELVEAAVKPPGAYKLIDTASVYQNEKFIGEVLNSMILSSIIQREDIFITSKLGPSEQGYDNCISAVKRSLENLQTSYLDLYLIHWPGVSGGVPPSDPKHSQLRKESWKAMEKMYEEGLLKNIGVSNYTVSHLEELLTYATVVPFANQLLSDEVVKSLASAHGKNAAQILLKWALQHDMSVIPKTENLGRLKENSELFDFTLTEDDMKKLDSLNKNIHYCWDPTSIL